MIRVLLGPNGSGKSTYLRKQIGLDNNKLQPDAGLVFQEPLLFDLTVSANVGLGLKFKRVANYSQKIDYWLDFFGIQHLAKRRALNLSGGEAQKVALARALALEPKYLYLDEPFANIDPSSRQELKIKLIELIRDRDISTVWVTHDKSEALTVADHLMIMLNFQVVQQGLPSEVILNPASKEIASLIDYDNIFQGQIVIENNKSFFQNEQIRFEVITDSHGAAWAEIHPVL